MNRKVTEVVKDTTQEDKTLSVREKRITFQNQKSLNHFKSNGVPLVHVKSNKRNKKQKKVSIEYGKGFFKINGEIRTIK